MPALQAPRGLQPPRRHNGQKGWIDQVRANSRPILTPCASTTVALTPGRDPALRRSRSPGLKLVSMFFFVNFWARQMRVPSPGPIPAPLALPSPPAGPHGGGPLNSESAIVPVPVAVALAPLTRFPLHVRADSDLCEARARGGPAAPPPPRLRQAYDPPAAPSRRPLHHTHSHYLSHHSHILPHPSQQPQPLPITPFGASRHPVIISHPPP